MNTRDFILKSNRVVFKNEIRPMAIGVSGEKIVSADNLKSASVIDFGNQVIMSGIVDTHAHINEPGRTEWEGFETATRAAAAGGITTIVDMPLNSIPPTVDVAALETKKKAADGKCAVDVGFWGGAVPGNLPELRALHEAGVFGFKCFLLDSGVEEFPPLSADQLETYLHEVASLGGLMIVHAEDAGEIARAPDGGGGRYADFLRSRPDVAESRAVDTVLAALPRTRRRPHARPP